MSLDQGSRTRKNAPRPAEGGGLFLPEKTIMSGDDIRRALVRIAHEAVETLGGCGDMVMIGIHTRGVPLAQRIAAVIKGFENVEIPVGALDIGPHRDDLSRNEAPPHDPPQRHPDRHHRQECGPGGRCSVHRTKHTCRHGHAR